MKNNDTLGRRIKGFRRLRRMTQQQLAVYLGMSASQLSSIERGLKVPRPELLEKIAAKLNVSLEELTSIPAEPSH